VKCCPHDHCCRCDSGSSHVVSFLTWATLHQTPVSLLPLPGEIFAPACLSLPPTPRGALSERAAYPATAESSLWLRDKSPPTICHRLLTPRFQRPGFPSSPPSTKHNARPAISHELIENRRLVIRKRP